MSDLFTFGIDLGTTNSCAAFSKNGVPTVIVDDGGKRTIPSIVSYTDDISVGSAAKNNLASNMKNTIRNAKRLIGHKYSEVKKDLQYFGFKVESDNDNPIIVIEQNGRTKRLKPQEVSAEVLKILGTFACRDVGQSKYANKHVVITVPAYFNDIQRRATIEAGELAGLNVLQIINEPTAAAIAYGYKYVKEKANRTILVYDFGGGTFDVSIIEVKNNEITVKATGGDTHLGGEDIDNNLVNYYIEKLKEEAGIDITKDAKKMWRLRMSCEKAKCFLADMNDAEVDFDLLEENDIDNNLTRPLLTNLNSNIYDKTLDIVQKVLSDSGLSKTDIEDIVLVGGSSRIVEVQKRLKTFFKRDELNLDINPDEAVAIGAGLLAEDLSRGIKEKQIGGKKVLVDVVSGNTINSNNHGRKVLVGGSSTATTNNGFKVPIQGRGRKILINDISPQSVGIRLCDGTLSIVVPKGTGYNSPQVRDGYFPSSDYSDSVTWNVYEGDKEMADDCRFLYRYSMNDIPPKPKSDYNFKVTMCRNDNGLIDVDIVEQHGIVDDTHFVVNIGVL